MRKNICEMLAKEDSNTAMHSGRVAKIADVLGHALALDDTNLQMLDEAARLHDIGKVEVDKNILNKPARLTDEEFAAVKKHTLYGFEIVRPENAVLAGIVLSHHERYDGNGYPCGLSGESIPYLSRIIAVADSIDAMMSDRCYRKALSWSTCLDELDKNRSKMYDPDIVDAAFACCQAILDIVQQQA